MQLKSWLTSDILIHKNGGNNWLVSQKEKTKRYLPNFNNFSTVCTHWVNLQKNCMCFETVVRVDKPRKSIDHPLEEDLDGLGYLKEKTLTS